MNLCPHLLHYKNQTVLTYAVSLLLFQSHTCTLSFLIFAVYTWHMSSLSREYQVIVSKDVSGNSIRLERVWLLEIRAGVLVGYHLCLEYIIWIWVSWHSLYLIVNIWWLSLSKCGDRHILGFLVINFPHWGLSTWARILLSRVISLQAGDLNWIISINGGFRNYL
jgi:hypothetical protein